jgi:hypothetical protein
MTTKRRLTQAEWAQVRARWQSDARAGFAWLADEIATAWGVAISRPALHKVAGLQAWAKIDEPSTRLQAASLSQRVKQKVTHKVTPPTILKVTRAARKVTQQTLATPSAPASDERVTHIGGDSRPVAEQAGARHPDEGQGEGSQAPAGTDKPWIAKPQPLGRPSKYRLEYAAELVKHFSCEPFEYIVIDADSGRTAQVPGKLPLLQEFAAKIGVASSTLRAWATVTDDAGNPLHPEFQAAYARARDLQQSVLIQGALAGAFDSRVACLALKNLAGWRDRVEVEEVGSMPDKANLELNYVTRMAAAHERQMAVLQRRGLLPDGADVGARN